MIPFGCTSVSSTPWAPFLPLNVVWNVIRYTRRVLTPWPQTTDRNRSRHTYSSGIHDTLQQIPNHPRSSFFLQKSREERIVKQPGWYSFPTSRRSNPQTCPLRSACLFRPACDSWCNVCILVGVLHPVHIVINSNQHSNQGRRPKAEDTIMQLAADRIMTFKCIHVVGSYSDPTARSTSTTMRPRVPWGMGKALTPPVRSGVVYVRPRRNSGNTRTGSSQDTP